MKVFRISILFCSLLFLFQGCVSQKIWVKEELQENFEEDYIEFMNRKGVVDNSDFQLEVFFDENAIEQKYEVITYNEVMPSLPFGIFYKAKWWRKHRLHTFLHHSYCTDLWSHADGFIAEPELGAVKFFRYQSSEKPQFNGMPIFPKNKGLAFGYNIKNSGGSYFDRIGFNASYSIDRDRNCMHNISHDFGLSFNYQSVNYIKSDGTNVQLPNITYNLRYKWIHSYALDEWVSNAFNKPSKFSDVSLEIGPVGYLLVGSQINEPSVSSSFRDFLVLGAHVAIEYKLNNNISLTGGVDKPMIPIKSILKPMSLLMVPEEANIGSGLTIFLNVKYNLNVFRE